MFVVKRDNYLKGYGSHDIEQLLYTDQPDKPWAERFSAAEKIMQDQVENEGPLEAVGSYEAIATRFLQLQPQAASIPDFDQIERDFRCATLFAYPTIFQFVRHEVEELTDIKGSRARERGADPGERSTYQLNARSAMRLLHIARPVLNDSFKRLTTDAFSVLNRNKFERPKAEGRRAAQRHARQG